jgi:iron complex outermembrane receptor protein
VGKSFTAFIASGRLDYDAVPLACHPLHARDDLEATGPGDPPLSSGSSAFRFSTFLRAYLDFASAAQLGVQFISAAKRADDPTFKVQPERITTVEASYLNQQSDSFEFEVTAYTTVTDLVALAVARQVSLSDKGAGSAGSAGHQPVHGRASAGPTSATSTMSAAARSAVACTR